MSLSIDSDIDIFQNGLIDIDIFNIVLIDIDIFQKCRYIDNRYSISIYRTGLLEAVKAVPGRGGTVFGVPDGVLEFPRVF